MGGATCISFRTMAVLAEELQLIKGSIERLRDRCELMLGEIAAMQIACEADLAPTPLLASAVSPLANGEIGGQCEDAAAVDGDVLPETEVEDDFWAALRAAVAEAPAFERLAGIDDAAACQADGMEEAIDLPAIFAPAAGKAGPPFALPASAATRGFPAPPGAATPNDAAAEAAAAPDETIGTPLAPIDCDRHRQRSRQAVTRPLTRYATLAALIATIVVTALASNGATRGFADSLPRTNGAARPS